MNENLGLEEQLFEQAAGISDEIERRKFLDTACTDNVGLRERLERLVQNAKFADKFFDCSSSALTNCPDVLRAELPACGTSVGRYKLLRQIGSGGEGVVYEALQEDPVRRTVALKIVRSGIYTSNAIARFASERQTLALMEHPSIARIFDGGATEAGVPFFAMELVRGIRITEFADQRRLSIRDRLRLFLQVCAAVQHAHQKRVIHRDLKPSNILVSDCDGVLVPKIIDFGIAKEHQHSADGRNPDDFGLVGTPVYMSPEQILGDRDVDTRTDLYSLGVILFELLVGCPPIGQKQFFATKYADFCKIVHDRVVPSPEMVFDALSESEQEIIANKRSMKRASLSRSLRGDVASIVLKALAKDRENRYQTASELAKDISHLLLHEPISARTPSMGYRMLKFTQRNKLGVGAAVTIVICILVVVITTVRSLVIEQKARRAAQQANAQERTQRLRAEADELRARRFEYDSEMNLAQQAFELNNRGRVRELLARSIPSAGEADLRGWEWHLLWDSTQSEAVRAIAQQESSIFGLAVTGDGTVATRDGAFDIRIRNDDGNEVAKFHADGYGRAFALTPNALSIVFGDYNEKNEPTIKIRDFKGVKAEFRCESPPIVLVTSGDGRFLAGMCMDSKVRVWSLDDHRVITSKAVAPPDGWHKGAMSFAPGSTFLAIGQTDGKVTIIDCSTWLAIAEFAASPEGITAMAISPDGLALVTASGFVKTTIEVWALPTLAHVSTLRGHESWVSALAFDPSQQRLASASGDQTVRLWNTATWEQISILRGHSDEVYTVAFSRDGKQLLSGSKAGELLLWASDVQGHSHFTEFPVPISNFAFIGEKSKMLILQQNGKLVLAAGGEQFTPLPVGSGDPDAKLAIQNESTTVAIAAKSGLTIWDWNEKRRIKTLAGENSSPVFVQFTSGYPHRLVLVDSIGRIRQWNTADWRESNVWTLDLKVNAAALSRDGIHLAIGCIDGTLETVDLVAKRVLGSVRGHQRVITSLDYNSDGSLLLTSSEDSLVKVWESSTLRTNAVLRGHLLGVHSTVFAPDDTRIVSASHDRQAIKVWDATTYEELVTLKGDGSFFHRTAFSHDGHTLASLNGKGILHIWTID